jgi:hypothetical protein
MSIAEIQDSLESMISMVLNGDQVDAAGYYELVERLPSEMRQQYLDLLDG